MTPGDEDIKDKAFSIRTEIDQPMENARENEDDQEVIDGGSQELSQHEHPWSEHTIAHPIHRLISMREERMKEVKKGK